MREVPSRLAQLDARRRWARLRAPLWFGLGIVTMSVALTGVGLVGLGMLGRLVSLVSSTPFSDLPLWGWAGWVAAGLALVGLGLAGASVGLSVLRHGADRVLRDICARRLDVMPDLDAGADADADATSAGGRTRAASDRPAAELGHHRLRNVVDGLSLGLGVEPPRLAVVEDHVPNALSVRGWRDTTLVATSGLLQLGRDEIEAVAAHELAHLYARDARWTTAAAASLGRVRGVAHLLGGVAGLLIILFFLGLDADTFLLTPLAGGLAIGGFALVIDVRVGAAQARLRSESDEIADVAAVLLARNPGALASACQRLALLPQRVARTTWRADHLWFAPLPEPRPRDGENDDGGRRLDRWRRARPEVDGIRQQSDDASAQQVRRVLLARAAAAYEAAGLPLPTGRFA